VNWKFRLPDIVHKLLLFYALLGNPLLFFSRRAPKSVGDLTIAVDAFGIFVNVSFGVFLWVKFLCEFQKIRKVAGKTE
jgi:hypothetical protein